MMKNAQIVSVIILIMYFFATASNAEVPSSPVTTSSSTPAAITPLSSNELSIKVKTPVEPLKSFTSCGYTYYYDKFGNIASKSKPVKNYTYYYEKTGKYEGKSKLLNDEVYYYDSLGAYIGICDLEGCRDKNDVQTNDVAPLPLTNFKN